MNHNFPTNTIVRPNPAHGIFHPSPISRGTQPTPQQYVNPAYHQQSFSTPQQQIIYEPTPHSQNSNIGSAFAMVNGNSLSQPQQNASVQPQQQLQNEPQQEIKNLLIFNCKGCRE